MLIQPVLTAALSLVALVTGLGLVLVGTRLRTSKTLAASTQKRALIETAVINLILLLGYLWTLLAAKSSADHFRAIPLTLLVLYAPGIIFATRLPPPTMQQKSFKQHYIRQAGALFLTLCPLNLIVLNVALGFSWQTSVFAVGFATSCFLIASYFRLLIELVSLNEFVSTPTGISRINKIFAIRSQPILTVGTGGVLLLWLAVLHLAETAPSRIYVPEILTRFSAYFKLTLYTDLTWLYSASVPVIIILLLGLVIGRRSTNLAATLFAFLCLLTGLYALEIYPQFVGPSGWTLRNVAFFLIGPVLLHLAFVYPNPSKRMGEAVSSLSGFLTTWLYVIYLPVTFPSLPFLQNPASLAGIPEVPPFLIPYLAPSLLCTGLSFPLAWLIGGWLLFSSYRKINKRGPITSTSSCRWFFWNQKKATRSQLCQLANQIKIAAFGMLLVTLVFLAWLTLSGIGIHAGFGEWFNLAGKFTLLAFFVTILLAIVEPQRRLWASSLAMKAVAWTGVLFALRGLVNWLATIITGWATVLFGLIALALFAWATETRLLERLAYKVFWRNKHSWHIHIGEVAESLRRPRKEQIDVRRIADSICPNEALASWLLVPNVDLDENDLSLFSVRDLRHEGECEGECRGKILNILGSDSQKHQNSYDGRTLDMEETLLCELQAGTVNNDVLVTHRGLCDVLNVPFVLRRLLRRWRSWRDDPRITPLKAPAGLLLSLVQAGIALLIPLGGKNCLSGCIVVSTDGKGDHYDTRDLIELRRFAQQLSVALASTPSRISSEC